MKKLLLLLPVLFLSLRLSAQVVLEQVFSSRLYTEPTDLTHAGDSSGRIFVVYKNGIIRMFSQADPGNSKIFLNITNKTVSSSEQGLLGLAFHPDYKHNGYLYVNYVSQTPNRHTVISRFKVSETNPDKADSTSELILLTFGQPYTNHNGGCIKFGPDGYLYIATGDGGSANDPGALSQNKNSFLGKMLRINVDVPDSTHAYSIPADNPFVNESNVRHEVYAYGLRNPWRFSYDSVSRRWWIGDVGQGAIEEVDTLVKGGNFGWRTKEGSRCTGNDGQTQCTTLVSIPPVYEYPHANSNLSITGGYVYRGHSAPSLVGKYIFGDYNSGRIYSLELLPDSAPRITQLTRMASISTFGVDQDGELYVANHSSGALYRIKDNTVTSTAPFGKSAAIRVSPNPAKGEVRVYVKATKLCGDKVELRDAAGRVVKTVKLPVAETRQDERIARFTVSDLPEGTYFAGQPCAPGGVKFVVTR